ncbi:GNAT family N-acetyltransferase [Butyrivibrio sp. WCD3002]|uniref:GNAT family N-acetyltransferase n=1 Tax=Butyrivibrio sp. WCD3002 TaxID=1280676 RepID=UPI0004212CCA|nr:GNAT family N-acetyltransferase [Butyrivibrio sp. WCD3002]
MLKEIIFCIKNDKDEGFVSRILETASYIKTEGIGSRAVYPNNMACSKENLVISLLSDTAEEKPEDVLFLTDSSEFAVDLISGGGYVVGISYEGNTDERFEGIKYVFTEIEEVGMDSFIKAYQRYAHLPWDILTTDRCLIRETTVEDVDVFYELYADPEMTRYMEGLFADPEDEKKYQRDYIEKVYGLMGFGTWTVVLKETGEIIGRAGYSVRNGFDDIEIGFLIGTAYQRKGYAYEVCKAILDYGRDILQFERVLAFVKAENTVSIHLCEKLGMVKAGEADIEENIYGDEYHDGTRIPAQEMHFGKYVKMAIEF